MSVRQYEGIILDTDRYGNVYINQHGLQDNESFNIDFIK